MAHQSQHTKTCLSIHSLPPEIRKEIFEYALEEDEVIEIGVWAKKHSEQELVRRPHLILPQDTVWFGEPQQTIRMSLLLTSRSVHNEASQAFYAANHFSFKHTAALEMFLARIGDNIQFLRYIDVAPGGLLKTSSTYCFKQLIKAKNLRLLRFAHYDFCHQGSQAMEIAWQVFVRDSKKLIHSLQLSYHARGINKNVLEVVQIAPVAEKPTDHPLRTRQCECGSNLRQVKAKTMEMQRLLRIGLQGTPRLKKR